MSSVSFNKSLRVVNCCLSSMVLINCFRFALNSQNHHSISFCHLKFKVINQSIMNRLVRVMSNSQRNQSIIKIMFRWRYLLLYNWMPQKVKNNCIAWRVCAMSGEMSGKSVASDGMAWILLAKMQCLLAMAPQSRPIVISIIHASRPVPAIFYYPFLLSVWMVFVGQIICTHFILHSIYLIWNEIG